MINTQEFAKLRTEFEQKEAKREKAIALARKALKNSKAAIYSLHRSDYGAAKKALESAKKDLKNAEKLSETNAGYLSDAAQEYTESFCYYIYLKDKKLATAKQTAVKNEDYLAGICDLIGELVRKAVNSGIKGDYKTATEIKEFAADVYAELMLFDFANGMLRKKFDSVKYALEKLEDIILRIKMK